MGSLSELKEIRKFENPLNFGNLEDGSDSQYGCFVLT